MNALARLCMQVRLLLGRGTFRSELEEEMEFHRHQLESDLVASGKTPEDAHRMASRTFGNSTHLRERSEEIVRLPVETAGQDIRFALRQLRKHPGFGLTAMLILALGMGVSLAMFGFVDAALLQPLPYAAPTRLLSVDESSAVFPRSNLSYDDWQDWKRLNGTLSDLEVYTGSGYLLRMGNVTEPVPAARVSDGFFRVLGVKPILGPDFLPGEDRPGKAKIVILPYGTWMKRFSGRSDVIGQSVTLSGASYTIVGVLPRNFSFAPRASAEFWLPLLDKTGCESRRSCHNLDGVGRLRDGATVQQAQADIQRIAAQLAAQYPGSNQGQGASVQPLFEIIVGSVRPILLTLLAGAALLLFIACVNVASLLLVRSESRAREVAIRGALGATSVRLVRQFVTEGFLLAAAGCSAGSLMGMWMSGLLIHLVPKTMAESMPFLNKVGMNAHTAVFALLVTLGAALVLSSTPVLRLSFLDLHQHLAEAGRGGAARVWRRLGANLVVVEITVAVVLLAGAGLLGKSLYKLLHVELGFDPTHLAIVNVMAREQQYPKAEQQVALYSEVRRRVTSLPGVVSVGLTTDLPVRCNCDTDWIRFQGKPFHGEHNEVNEREVDAAYLPTLKARLVRGRMLTEQDRLGAPQVMLINEALARKYFPGEDPVGQVVGEGDLAPSTLRTIVGVVSDVREGALDVAVWPAEYRTLEQNPSTYFSVAVRTEGDEKALLPELVATLRQINPDLGVYGEESMVEEIDASQAALLHRFSAWLVGGFAGMALLLSVVGLYGVIAYSVSQRTREIGVRMALGAQRGSVYRMVLQQAGRLTILGVGLGLISSVLASMLMQKVLFNVQAWDVPTLTLTAVVLAFASLLAAFLPARRAALVNPSDALRAE